MSGSSPSVPAEPADLHAPPLARRMAAFVYEGVLLFGVVFVAGYLYSALTQMRSGQKGTLGLQVFLFVVLGIYFVWFWSHGGQTVAMKAWHVRLVDAQGRAVSQSRAFLRYLLSWLWFAPALLAAHFSGLKAGGTTLAIVLAGVAAYAALTRLNPQRQFWHDVVGGTRLVDARTTA